MKVVYEVRCNWCSWEGMLVDVVSRDGLPVCPVCESIGGEQECCQPYWDERRAMGVADIPEERVACMRWARATGKLDPPKPQPKCMICGSTHQVSQQNTSLGRVAYCYQCAVRQGMVQPSFSGQPASVPSYTYKPWPQQVATPDYED